MLLAVVPIRRRTVKVVQVMNCGFIRYDRLRQIMSEHPSVLDRIRSFSKKRQRSEREKLASSDKLKRSDTLHSLVSDHDSTAPQARATEVLRKELHSGMTEWNWRQRVDGRLDALVRATNRSHPGKAGSEATCKCWVQAEDLSTLTSQLSTVIERMPIATPTASPIPSAARTASGGPVLQAESPRVYTTRAGLADRVEEALSPGCTDTALISALLGEVDAAGFSHPSVGALRQKHARMPPSSQVCSLLRHACRRQRFVDDSGS